MLTREKLQDAKASWRAIPSVSYAKPIRVKIKVK